MILGVAGSRAYPHLSDVRGYIRARADADPYLIVVSGGARGVDTEAEKAAKAADMKVISFRPIQLGDVFGILRLDYGLGSQRVCLVPGEKHPTYAAAAFARNRYIVDTSEEVVTFWDGLSNGTRNTRDLAAAARKLISAEAFV